MTAAIEETQSLWVKVSLTTVEQLHEVIHKYIETNHHEVILHVNVNGMNLAYESGHLRRLFNEAPVVFCDGAGVALALRILCGVHVPGRITYADWTWQLARFCESHRYSMFFLGGRPGVAEAAGARLRERFPGLRLVGCQHGYFDCEGSESQRVIDRINSLRPNVLLVGLGMPLQEEWLGSHHGDIRANVCLTGGAVFDFISGRTRRGPRFLVDHSFEWFVRFCVEPRRLWRRYLIGNPLFLWRAWRWTRRSQAQPGGGGRGHL